MAVSKRVRFEVFKRDRFTCQYCGRRPPEVLLHVDHVLAVAEGGSDEIANLTTSCGDCNLGKGAVNLGSVRPALDEMAQLEALQEMAERRFDLKQQAAVAEAHRNAEQEAIDTVLAWWCDVEPNGESFQADSIRRLLQRGLSLARISDAVRQADFFWKQRRYLAGYRAWRYFCGICWSMLRQDEADATT